MEQQYREMFDEVRSSSRLQEEVRKMSEMERKPAGRRFPRKILMVVAVLAVLAGTAVAAVGAQAIRPESASTRQNAHAMKRMSVLLAVRVPEACAVPCLSFIVPPCFFGILASRAEQGGCYVATKGQRNAPNGCNSRGSPSTS